MQNNIQAQLESVNNYWLSLENIPEDLGLILVEGFTKQHIDDALMSLLQITEAINEDDSFEPDMISLATAQNKFQILKQHIATNLTTNPEAYLPGFILQINSLRELLLEWADLAETRKQKVSRALIQRLGVATAKAEEIRTLHAELKKEQEELVAKFKEMDALYKKVSEGEPEFDSSLKDITLKSNEVTKLELKARQDSEKLSTVVAELNLLKEEVDEARVEQDALFAQFSGYKETISQTLGDANRVSMAGAFIAQRDKYNTPLENWNRIFVLSIIVLVFMAVWLIAPFMTSGKWIDIIIRLPLTAPAIWLAWFASRQYGHISKLREDYAYKAAAAMAFEGYKREASEAGDAMQSKLLDTAINQLAENPIRIYQNQTSGHDDPLNEFLDKHFKDKKFIDAFTNLIKAIRS